MKYEGFFAKATGSKPFPYQTGIADAAEMPEALSAPTGAGKTAAVIVGWLWRRLHADPATRRCTPRRLVYCLPMRVLVEQTVAAASGWLRSLDLGADIRIHVLMGGEDQGDWDLWPERNAIVIGTQDMLLSAALNRGFGTSRSRWPMRYGLLNSECLWVFDEVQLMGSGLATTSQLQAFRESMGTAGPCRSLWMSATLRKDWLATVDYRARAQCMSVAELGAKDRSALKRRLTAPKRLEKAKADPRDAGAVAEFIKGVHVPGSLTLAVVNTVARAVDLHDELKGVYSSPGKSSRGKRERPPPAAGPPEVILLHSRFRPPDREVKMAALLARPPEQGRIVVSTQVIEAGVDVSARTLVTELAPWPSLVQRLGRCNRYGEHDDSRAFWVDLPSTGKQPMSPPYDPAEVDVARKEIARVRDGSPSELADHLERLSEAQRAALFPYAPRHVIRKKDALELFDTTPDLAGNDIDVSRFIRDGADLDALVFWRALPDGETPSASTGPDKDELCPVPAGELRAWLLADRNRRLWLWSFLDGRWRLADAGSVRPGHTYLIPATHGGYTRETGWTPDSRQPVDVLGVAGTAADSNTSDRASSGPPQTIADHTREVIAQLETFAPGLQRDLLMQEEHLAALVRAAVWHDRGTAHEVFQEAARGETASDVELLAKAPSFGKYARKGFRHELASALAMLAEGISDLACYLAAAHHGKVRLSLRSLPGEKQPLEDRRFARGVWDGDVLLATDLGGEVAPEAVLSLEPMDLGLSADGRPSWAERMLDLRDSADLGVFRLAFLEALLRAADMRASAAHTKKEAASA